VRLVAFVASTDLSRSRAFYVEQLGLPEIEETDFALVVDGGSTTLRITKVDSVIAAPNTVLGWDVDDIDSCVDRLHSSSVDFVDYETMGQDSRLIWTSPSGTRVAWMRDPDGNVLSIQQHPDT
jgi:catechol 2,3-dioxygenase-like lactoylglutathione lyase family enzyme